MTDPKSRRRILIRRASGAILVLVVLALGPTDLATEWTGLAPGPAVTLVLVIMAAVDDALAREEDAA